MKSAFFLDIDGQSVEVARSGVGTGLPILLLHEGLGSLSMWRDFPDQLANATGREVIAWSRQGHGSSSMGSVSFEPDYMHREAELVPTLCDALAIRRCHMLGHSDGGSIALIAAALAPTRIASLILEAPHVFVEDLTVESIAQIRENFELSAMSERLARYHLRPEEMFWRWNKIWLDPRFRSWTIEDRLSAIVAPILFIQGREDQYGTMDQFDRVAARVPGVQKVELSACGHSPHRDQPRDVLLAISAFLVESP